MEEQIPLFLQEMLTAQYGDELFRKILSGYEKERAVTLRVNTLKTDVDSVKQCLTDAGISFSDVSWSKEALIIENVREEAIRNLPIYGEGAVYLQSLSASWIWLRLREGRQPRWRRCPGTVRR